MPAPFRYKEIPTPLTPDTEMACAPSSSADAMQPAKEAGQGAASKDDVLMSPPPPTPPTPTSKTDKRNMKRARTNGGTASSDPPSSSTTTPSSSTGLTTPYPVSEKPATTSPSSSSEANASVSVPSHIAASPNLPIKPAVNSPTAPSTTSYGEHVPTWISQSKLLQVAGIDNRNGTAIDVRFTVDARCPQLPIVDSLQYKMDGPTKLRMVAAFLGSSDGLHIVAPILPHSPSNLLMTSDQQQWYTELNRQRSKYGDIIRDGGGLPDEQKAACEELFNHLQLLSAPTPSSSSPLWAQDQLTKTWRDLLIVPSAIRANSTRQIYNPSLLASSSTSNAVSTPSATSFTLSLHAATVEASYVVACQLIAYSLVKYLAPSLTAEWKKILDGGVTSSTDSTESESSDSDKEGWEHQRQSAHTQHRIVTRKLGRVRRELLKRIASFTSTPSMVRATTEAYSPITKRPLLALSTSLSMRPVTRPYVSYVLDNFQSAGCDIHNLASDPTYQKIITCIPELSPPGCYWSVSHRIGNAVVSLWAPAEYRDLVVELNARLRAMLSSPHIALRISTSVMKKTKRGGIDRQSSIMVSLTPETKVTPPPLQARPTSSTSAPSSSSPPTSSYATALASGVKRAYESSALNHRPRKEQKTPTAPSLQPPTVAGNAAHASSLLPAFSHQHGIVPSSLHQTSPAPPGVLVPLPGNAATTVTSVDFDSRLIALERSLTVAMENRISSMFETLQSRMVATMGRMMESLGEKMMGELGKNIATIVTALLQQRIGIPHPLPLSYDSPAPAPSGQDLPSTSPFAQSHAHPPSPSFPTSHASTQNPRVPASPTLSGPANLNG
jgi:hypothetical protein